MTRGRSRGPSSSPTAFCVEGKTRPAPGERSASARASRHSKIGEPVTNAPRVEPGCASWKSVGQPNPHGFAWGVTRCLLGNRNRARTCAGRDGGFRAATHGRAGRIGKAASESRSPRDRGDAARVATYASVRNARIRPPPGWHPRREPCRQQCSPSARVRERPRRYPSWSVHVVITIKGRPDEPQKREHRARGPASDAHERDEIRRDGLKPSAFTGCPRAADCRNGALHHGGRFAPHTPYPAPVDAIFGVVFSWAAPRVA